MANEAENQDGTPRPSLPVALRIEEISGRDVEKLREAAKAPSDLVLRVRRESQGIPTRGEPAKSRGESVAWNGVKIEGVLSVEYSLGEPRSVEGEEGDISGG